MKINVNYRFFIVLAVLLIFSVVNTYAATDDSHSPWIDVVSADWGSHKPVAGSASQIKIMNTYVLVKMNNGNIKKVWNARFMLKDGRDIAVDKGRLLNTASKQQAEKKHSADTSKSKTVAADKKGEKPPGVKSKIDNVKSDSMPDKGM